MASGPWSTEAGGKGHACYLDCLRSPPAVAPVDTWSWGPVLQCQETQCRITARHCQRRGETWKNTVQTGVSREVPGLPSQKIRFQTQTTTLSLQIRAAECLKDKLWLLHQDNTPYLQSLQTFPGREGICPARASLPTHPRWLCVIFDFFSSSPKLKTVMGGTGFKTWTTSRRSWRQKKEKKILIRESPWSILDSRAIAIFVTPVPEPFWHSSYT